MTKELESEIQKAIQILAFFQMSSVVSPDLFRLRVRVSIASDEFVVGHLLRSGSDRIQEARWPSIHAVVLAWSDRSVHPPKTPEWVAPVVETTALLAGEQ